MTEYRIVEEKFSDGTKRFVPEIREWWHWRWRRFFIMRGGDDPCPPLKHFPTLEEANTYLKYKTNKVENKRIHSF